MKKYFSLICVFLLLIGCAACSNSGKEQNKKQDVVRNEEEIERKYDEYFGSGNTDKPLSSDASVLGKDFSAVDFTFTSADDTMAYTLYDNSFVKINGTGFYFDAISLSDGSLINDSASFKTARGITLGSSATDFMQKYNVSDENALYKKISSPEEDISDQGADGDETGYYYNPSNGNFVGKLTVLYGLTDADSYGILPSEVVQKFISVRDINANGDYMNPQKIMDEFAIYQSLVSVDITADEAGTITEIAVYKFDK